jgi:hypothetical protein
MSLPTNPFPVGIRVGNTSTGTPVFDLFMDHLDIEGNTVGVQILRGNHIVMRNSVITTDSVNDLQVGGVGAGQTVSSLRLIAPDIEMLTGSNTNISVVNVTHMSIENCVGENSGAGFWLDIPATAITANVSVRDCYFAANNAPPFIFRVNKATATLTVEDSYAAGYPGASNWINASAAQDIWTRSLHSDANIGVASGAAATSVTNINDYTGTSRVGDSWSTNTLSLYAATFRRSAGNPASPDIFGNGAALVIGDANGVKTGTGAAFTDSGGLSYSKVIASGTSTLTSNAALAAVTSQAAITTTATGALTTDAIEWSYATAPTAGDSLCNVSPYVTAGNVNFVRTNPTAAAQNVSALVINWRVIR